MKRKVNIFDRLQNLEKSVLVLKGKLYVAEELIEMYEKVRKGDESFKNIEVDLVNKIKEFYL